MKYNFRKLFGKEAIICTLTILWVLLVSLGLTYGCFMVTMLVGQQISISQKKDELQQLKNELKEQQVVNDELRYDLNEENADNTDYAEKVARRELDYVKPGERVFYNVGGNN